MNAVNIRLARDGHDREVVILALQRYLATHWVRILEDGTDWVVELESKMPSQEPASVQMFNMCMERQVSDEYEEVWVQVIAQRDA